LFAEQHFSVSQSARDRTLPEQFVAGGVHMPVGSAIRLIGPLITIGVGGVVPVGYVALIIAFGLALATRVTNQWQRAIVLRLGKFSGVRGPGVFFITPIDSVAYLIDLRTMTTPFRAEQAMTADTVPVDVDAVLFWRVTDPHSAALEVENYSDAVSMAAQTALSAVIGRSTLAAILSERQSINNNLRTVIDTRTQSWGVHVESVELRHVEIPGSGTRSHLLPRLSGDLVELEGSDGKSS
jgi:regulator of protease activity HflC (stomatin/prohibitin superfamily)